MTDIVERLLRQVYGLGWLLRQEAAAEIERLRHAAKSDAAQIAEQARVIQVMTAEIERLQSEEQDMDNEGRLLSELEHIQRNSRTDPEQVEAEHRWLIRAVEHILRERVGSSEAAMERKARAQDRPV